MKIAPTASADLAEPGEIPVARIARAASNDDLGLMLVREAFDCLHVDGLVLRLHAVGNDLEPLARHVGRRAVREMAACGEIEAHECVAGLHQPEEDRLVRLRPGIRLHIGKPTAKQAAGTLDCERFGDVDELASAIIAPSGIALGVFVGHHRALRLENGAGDDILRGDELDLFALAAEFLCDGAGDLGIAVG